MDLFISSKLYLDKSSIPNAGYGVFTNEDIEEGEIIEVSKFIKVGFNLYDNLDKDILSVLYNFPKKDTEYFAIVLGYGSLYNSSLDDISNNVDWITDKDNEVFIYHCTSKIKRGEELFIYYNNYEFNNYEFNNII